MTTDDANDDLKDRVSELISLYSTDRVSTAEVLCDGRDPSALAYRIVAPTFSARDLTYGELREESERFAGALTALGVKPGDRVATLMGKSREYLVTLMAVWRLGAVHVPLFTAFAPPAIAFRLTESGARLVVCDAEQERKLEPGTDTPESSPWRVLTTGAGGKDSLSFKDAMANSTPVTSAAALGGDAPLIHVFTSGTTGRPKGVVMPVKGLAACHAYAEFGLGLRAGELYWCGADPGWAYGLYFGVLACLSTGVPGLLFEGGFTPEATYEVLSRYRPANFAAAPTVYRAMRASTTPMPGGVRLRCGSSAGEPLTPEVNEWAQDALGVPVHDHYGQTEVGMLVNNHHHPDLNAPIKQGSMGKAMPGWKAVVLHPEKDEPAETGQVGRLAMDLSESPLCWFEGYHNNPGKTAEKFSDDGRWYYTGDTASIDDDGYVFFSSRDDDVIIMAGYRIGPFDVESVIATHPDVAECAIVAAPDEIRGEVIEAFIVPQEGVEASDTLTEEIQQRVKTQFAAHAYPRSVHYLDRLPKTPSGKIQRFVLREQRRKELQDSSETVTS